MYRSVLVLTLICLVVAIEADPIRPGEPNVRDGMSRAFREGKARFEGESTDGDSSKVLNSYYQGIKGTVGGKLSRNNQYSIPSSGSALEQAQKGLSAAQSSIVALRQDLEAERLSKAKLEAEIDMLKKNLNNNNQAEQDREQLKKNLATSERSVQELQTKYAEQEQRVAEANKRSAYLESQLAEKEVKSVSGKVLQTKLEEEIEKLKKDSASSCDEQINLLKAHLRESQTAKTTLEINNNDLVDKLSIIEQDRKRLNQNLQELKLKNTKLEQLVFEANKKSGDLEAQSVSGKAQQSKLEDEIKTLKKNTNELIAQLQESQKALLAQEVKTNDLNDKLNTNENDKRQLEQIVEELKNADGKKENQLVKAEKQENDGIYQLAAVGEAIILESKDFDHVTSKDIAISVAREALTLAHTDEDVEKYMVAKFTRLYGARWYCKLTNHMATIRPITERALDYIFYTFGGKISIFAYRFEFVQNE